LSDVIENNNGILKQIFIDNQITLVFALNYIADLSESQTYTINKSKVKKQLALALLHYKGDYYLKEFI
jgi:hypothetical protein